MKVNFTKMKIKPTLHGPEETIDLKGAVAEAVYQFAPDLATHKLAHRIDAAEGEMEISDKEMVAIKAAIAGWRYFAQLAVFEAFGEQLNTI